MMANQLRKGGTMAKRDATQIWIDSMLDEAASYVEEAKLRGEHPSNAGFGEWLGGADRNPTVASLLEQAYAVGADLEQQIDAIKATTDRDEALRGKLRWATKWLSEAVTALEALND